MKRKSSTALLSLLLLVGCSVEAPHSLHVEIDDLLERPEAFDGKIVSVAGYLIVEREDVNLFSNQSEYEDGGSNHCIHTDLTESHFEDRTNINKKVVEVTGRFDSDFCGPEQICFDSCSEGAIVVDEISVIHQQSTGSIRTARRM